MKTIPLQAQVRTKVGKQGSKQIRSQKRIPAIVYGSGMKATAIHVAMDEFLRVIHTKAGENVVIRITVGGANGFEKNVLIKEIQHDPVTDRVDHVDFNVISMTEKIKVKVPLYTEGQSMGVKEGGVLDVIHHEIEVECLPADIPERLIADVSALKIGDSIHGKELTFPQGVTPMISEDEVVIAVHAPKVEEAPVPEEVSTEPEVIGKEKKEGEEAEEGAPAKPAEGKEAAPKAKEGEKKH